MNMSNEDKGSTPKDEGSTIGAIIFLAIIVLVGAGIWWGVSSWMDGDDTTAVEDPKQEEERTQSFPKTYGGPSDARLLLDEWDAHAFDVLERCENVYSSYRLTEFIDYVHDDLKFGKFEEAVFEKPASWSDEEHNIMQFFYLGLRDCIEEKMFLYG